MWRSALALRNGARRAEALRHAGTDSARTLQQEIRMQRHGASAPVEKHRQPQSSEAEAGGERVELESIGSSSECEGERKTQQAPDDVEQGRRHPGDEAVKKRVVKITAR